MRLDCPSFGFTCRGAKAATSLRVNDLSQVRELLGRNPMRQPDQKRSRTTVTLLNFSNILSAIHTTFISVTIVFNHRSPAVGVRGLRFHTVCSRGCGIYYPFTPLHPACIAAPLGRTHERETSPEGSRQRVRSTKEGKRMKSFESPGATLYSPCFVYIPVFHLLTSHSKLVPPAYSINRFISTRAKHARHPRGVDDIASR
jgi:hypothetical protein